MKINKYAQAGGRNIPCRGRQATESKTNRASPEGDTIDCQQKCVALRALLKSPLTTWWLTPPARDVPASGLSA